MYDLSEFEKFVLSEILLKISDKEEFNLYELIRTVIVHKDVSSFPESLVSETSEHIDLFLAGKGILNELKEKRIYSFTEKGIQSLTLWKNCDPGYAFTT